MQLIIRENNDENDDKVSKNGRLEVDLLHEIWDHHDRRYYNYVASALIEDNCQAH